MRIHVEKDGITAQAFSNGFEQYRHRDRRWLFGKELDPDGQKKFIIDGDACGTESDGSISGSSLDEVIARNNKQCWTEVDINYLIDGAKLEGAHLWNGSEIQFNKCLILEKDVEQFQYLMDNYYLNKFDILNAPKKLFDWSSYVARSIDQAIHGR